MSFSKTVMSEILSFSDLDGACPPLMEISVLTFVVKKSTVKLSGVSILGYRRQNLKSNVVLIVVPVLKSKALIIYYMTAQRLYTGL